MIQTGRFNIRRTKENLNPKPVWNCSESAKNPGCQWLSLSFLPFPISGALTTCEKQAVAALENIDLFMPECDANGAYKQIQCQEGSCWCVDKKGIEREGTRIEGQPNCTIGKPISNNSS